MIINRPPMGWNSWNTFGEEINEDVVKESADALVSTGLKDAGYEYVVIDDCWSLRERDENGNLVADPKKFPSGMKALADYIHSKGLKFGMYSCAGTQTCAGYPGSFNHEFQDAKTFASWGVDYLKYDYCYRPGTANGPLLYQKMGIALRECGRDILFSACNWGSDDVWNWIRATGAHCYRSTGDLGDNFNGMKDICKSQLNKQCFNAPNCFNDVDMLIVGMYNKGNVGWGGCTDQEYWMHFGMWCMLSSPLMIGADVRNLSEEALKILKCKGLIAINQDAECRQTIPIPNSVGGDYISLYKIVEDGYVFGFFNFTENHQGGVFYLTDIGLGTESGYGLQLTNVVTGDVLPVIKDDWRCQLAPHTSAVFKAKVVPIR